MQFIKSYEMKVSVLQEQEKQLSSKEKIRKAILEDNTIAFDIVQERKIIGFALLRKFDEGCYFLWDYAIDAEFQNRHYGTMALRELIQFMKAKYNMHTLTTTYIWGNQHAKHVYESVGFKETDVVDEDGIHEVNMEYSA